jgi:hypothetical protein
MCFVFCSFWIGSWRFYGKFWCFVKIQNSLYAIFAITVLLSYKAVNLPYPKFLTNIINR